MSINGFALLVAAGFVALVGVACYAWGYWDGREAESKAGRRTWTIYGRAVGSERRRAPRKSEAGRDAR